MLRLEPLVHPMPIPAPILRRPKTRAPITGPRIEISTFFTAAFVFVGKTLDGSYFDFNSILPVPEDLRSVWRGTDLRFQKMDFDVPGITFRTAWNGVRPLFEKLREVYPNLTVDLQWAAPSTVKPASGTMDRMALSERIVR